MEPRTFLSSYDKGIHRAERSPGGLWQVQTLEADRRVTCLAADRSDPQRIFAGTPSGALLSTDAGRTWQPSGLETDVYIKSMAVSPVNPQHIYAGAKGALMYKSEDGGATWRELEAFREIPNRWWWFSPAEPPDRRPYVMAIAPSPTDENVVLAGIEYGAVVRSQDGGQTWSAHREGGLRDCHDLKFHASDGQWVYEAGGSGGGAAISQDGGQNFVQPRTGLATNYGFACAADGVDPQTWYAAVAPGPGKAYSTNSKIYLYRSKAGGDWQPIGWEAHPMHISATALVTIPGQAGHLYAGLVNGDIWHSPDHGNSWVQLPFNLKGIWHWLLVLP
jgi:hypothetical protein